MQNTMKAPSAPTSVGVAQPVYMPPITAPITKMIGSASGSVTKRSRHGMPGTDSPSAGLILKRTTMIAA
ncbi:hypothetical protein D3C83_151180 [compost metagenome]